MTERRNHGTILKMRKFFSFLLIGKEKEKKSIDTWNRTEVVSLDSTLQKFLLHEECKFSASNFVSRESFSHHDFQPFLTKAPKLPLQFKISSRIKVHPTRA